MSEHTFHAAGISDQALIDQAQWQRLLSELGGDMLVEFAQEFFDEALDTWVNAATSPYTLDEKPLRSLAHRTAGAAGTLGFQRLRYTLLCMEHCEQANHIQQLHPQLLAVLDDTQAWVRQST